MKVDAKQYVELAMETLSPNFHPELVEPNLLHGALGLVTESSEFADAVKRALFYGKPMDKVNLIEELGDITWYLALICKELDVDIEEVFATNIKKLKKRFPEKFTKHNALFRDLEGEYETLKESVDEAN